MVKKILAFVQKDIQEQNKKYLSVKNTYQSYSAEVYFSSLEKHESLHKIYLNHIKFKIFSFGLEEEFKTFPMRKRVICLTALSVSAGRLLLQRRLPKGKLWSDLYQLLFKYALAHN